MRVLADIFYDRKVDNIPQLIDESIGFSELNDFIDAPLKTYSKGMLLRLTLSLLSAKPTDLLILDEVFDGADEFFRKKLSLRVRNLINNSSAVILVSHQEEQILEICNRVIVMKAGRIIFDGDPAKAFEVYRNNE
jgi:ABC-type polysaccharide/polyol phosphate transport system ATPase subunit